MCILCATRAGDGLATARRVRMLQLLALLEHSDALPADRALRLGKQLLSLLPPETPALQCSAVSVSSTSLEQEIVS